MRTALIVPTKNGAGYLERWFAALDAQSLQPDEILVVDSGSTDGGPARWSARGAQVLSIDPATFNHGGTRQLAAGQVTADVLIYMTQDAIPVPPDAFALLVDGVHAAADVGVAYGRQLPHPGASVLAAHARQFNYPVEGRIKRLADVGYLGIKTCFSSDAFAAYSRPALEAVGGFPSDVIGSEDAYVAARMLQAGYAVNYVAQAQAWHSHDYTMVEEFRRYFDIGVFYSREAWIGRAFGGAGGEGRRFVQSEMGALAEAGQAWRIPSVLARSAMKLLGYRLGHMEAALPAAIKARLGMYTGYWRS